MMKAYPNIHPGEILREEFLKPHGLAAKDLALDIGLPADYIQAIADGAAAICAEVAVRLARYFGTSEKFWLEAQMTYDLERVRRQASDSVARIRPLACAA